MALRLGTHKRWITRGCVALVVGAVLQYSVALSLVLFGAPLTSNVFQDDFRKADKEQRHRYVGYVPDVQPEDWPGVPANFEAQRGIGFQAWAWGALTDFGGGYFSDVGIRSGWPLHSVRHREMTQWAPSVDARLFGADESGDTEIVFERTVGGSVGFHRLPVWFTHSGLIVDRSSSFFFLGHDLPIVPSPVGTIVNTLAYASALIASWLGASRIRRRVRMARGLCPACAYDRKGSDAHTPCPECGHTQEAGAP